MYQAPSIRYLAAIVLAGAVAVSAISGCAVVRKATYPADFVYLSRDDVSTGMQRIAGHLVSIEQALQEPDPDTAGETARLVIRHLEGMRQVAVELGADAVGTNHLLLDAHMQDFLAQLELARNEAATVPPRFYAAGKLVGSCSSCHRYH